MFPAGCASEIRGQTKAGVNLRAQLEVPTDLSGSSSVGASPPSLQETGGYMAQVRGAGTWYRGAEPCASSPETEVLVFMSLLACCVTRTSHFTSLGLRASMGSMEQRWEGTPALQVYVGREGEGCDLTDCRGPRQCKGLGQTWPLLLGAITRMRILLLEMGRTGRNAPWKSLNQSGRKDSWGRPLTPILAPYHFVALGAVVLGRSLPALSLGSP